MRPFAREVLNATGLAFGPDGYLYVSSRAEGTVYRISPAGAISVATNEPGDTMEETARIRVGNYGLRYFDGMLNLPVGNDAAFRLTLVDNADRLLQG